MNFWLWKGLDLAISGRIKIMLVLGVPMIAIRKVFKLKSKGQNPNSAILKKIVTHLKKFEELAFFHIYRPLNVGGK